VGAAILLLLPRQWYTAALAAIVANLLEAAHHLKEGRYQTEDEPPKAHS
jgi:hypothetical protein